MKNAAAAALGNRAADRPKNFQVDQAFRPVGRKVSQVRPDSGSTRVKQVPGGGKVVERPAISRVAPVWGFDVLRRLMQSSQSWRIGAR